MIAAWVGYAMFVGLVVAVAGLAAERAMLLLRRPVRGVWVATLAVSVALPLVGSRLPWHFPLPIRAASPLSLSPALPFSDGVEPEAPPASDVEAAPDIGRVVVLLWGAASFLLSAYLLYSIGVLQGRRREWRRETLDGMEVLVAPDLGPAVIGWRRLVIVVPEWVHGLAVDARQIVLRHEAEHVARRDPRLLGVALLPILVFPWNLALWWQVRRLRRAIELDCDARVVRSGVAVGRYARVLLEAGRLCGSRGLPALATFAERPADLESRIDALTLSAGRSRAPKVLAAIFGAAILVVSACLTPDPTSPIGEKAALDLSRSPGPSIRLRGRDGQQHPSDMVVIIQAPSGELLQTFEADRVSLILKEIDQKDIGMIEVAKGTALRQPGIGGVIVVTLSEPGYARYLARHADTLHDQLDRRRTLVRKAMQSAGPVPTPETPEKFLWFEATRDGQIRASGYTTDKVALIRRGGRGPVETGTLWNGMIYTAQTRLPTNPTHWARYEVP